MIDFEVLQNSLLLKSPSLYHESNKSINFDSQNNSPKELHFNIKGISFLLGN